MNWKNWRHGILWFSVKRAVVLLCAVVSVAFCAKDADTAQVLMVARASPKKVLYDFYPLANVLCKDIFPALDVEQVCEILDELIDLFDRRQWQYFCETPAQFDGMYLDRIVAELRAYLEFTFSFITNGYVGEHRGRLKQICITVAALYCDFLIVKINSYAMRTNLNGNHLQDCYSILDELTQVIGLLSNSKYDSYYQRALQSSRRIVELLQKHVEAVELRMGYRKDVE